VAGAQVLFIPDPKKLARQWSDQNAKDIWIYKVSLQAFNRDEFLRNYKGEYLTEADLFLAEFYFLKGDSQLPGAQLPQGTEQLTYIVDNNVDDNVDNNVDNNKKNNEKNLTPLLPINPKLLNYFSATELNEILELQPVVIDSRSGVSVTIKLPLSGGTYKVTKQYAIAKENAIETEAIPFLELWPNFEFDVKSKSDKSDKSDKPDKPAQWSEYYAFYYDDRSGDLDHKIKTRFQVVFPQVFSQAHPEKLVDFQITRLTKFPSYMICQKGHQSAAVGVILLTKPEEFNSLDPNKTWRVGVDFGTSFTHVYYQPDRGLAQPLTWDPLLLKVTNTDDNGRAAALYRYFSSPKEEDFPLATVLTTEGHRGNTIPIFDGRIYIPEDISNFDSTQEHIETELKWRTGDIPYKELFLKHLALVIAAEAAKNGVRKIEWTISYPTAFSNNYKRIYEATWANIINELGQKTGMTHHCLPKQKGRYYRSESIALAHYFESAEKQSLGYTTCIDLGGGTADISIWQKNSIIHQCSIKLGGRLLFSQFIKPKFLEEVIKYDPKNADKANDDQSEVKISDEEAKGEEKFSAKVDTALRRKSEQWLKDKRKTEPINTDGNKSITEFGEIIQGAAIGIAGLYYYLGIILKGLFEEKKTASLKITPVLIGGNGSRLLHWLDSGGKFTQNSDINKLLSRMLSAGAGIDDIQQETETRLSKQPKAEVACGLVADQQHTQLTGMNAEDENKVFAGEQCKVTGKANEIITVEANQRISFPKIVNKFEVSELTNLEAFLTAFDNSVEQLKMK